MLFLQGFKQKFHELARGGVNLAGASLQATVSAFLPPILFDYEVESDLGNHLDVFSGAVFDLKLPPILINLARLRYFVIKRR